MLTIDARSLTEIEYRHFFSIMQDIAQLGQRDPNDLIEFTYILNVFRRAPFVIIRNIGVKIKVKNQENIVFSSFSKN